MMNIYEIRRQNLIYLINTRAGGIAAKFAKRINKDASYIRRCTYEEGKSGKKNISDEVIIPILNTFNLPPGWMDTKQWLSGVASPESARIEWNSDYVENAPAKIIDVDHDNVDVGPSIRGKVPLISSVQAGLWCEAIDNYHVGDHEDLLDCPKSCGKNAYALRVKGDSMTNPIPGGKTYPEGTIIFVDPSQSITSGCRVIAKLPYSNEATFKEYREEDGKRWLKPLNPTYDKIEVTAEIRLCGVVIGKWEDD